MAKKQNKEPEEIEVEQITDLSTSPLGAQLEALTGKALTKLDEILNIEVKPATVTKPDGSTVEVYDASDVRILSMQKDAAGSVIVTQAKVNETAMRAKEGSNLQKVIERILMYDKREKAELIAPP